MRQVRESIDVAFLMKLRSAKRKPTDIQFIERKNFYSSVSSKRLQVLLAFRTCYSTEQLHRQDFLFVAYIEQLSKCYLLLSASAPACFLAAKYTQQCLILKMNSKWYTQRGQLFHIRTMQLVSNTQQQRAENIFSNRKV